MVMLNFLLYLWCVTSPGTDFAPDHVCPISFCCEDKVMVSEPAELQGKHVKPCIVSGHEVYAALMVR